MTRRTGTAVMDEDGQVVDVLLRDHRDTASAEAFFRQAVERAELVPEEVVTDRRYAVWPDVRLGGVRPCG